MRYRELTLRPVRPVAHASGATVHRSPTGGQIAVLRGRHSAERGHALSNALHAEGFKGILVVLSPGEEFTLCEVEDGVPARWQEDGRPSYADLERRVKELEAREAGMAAGAAACGPAFIVMR